MADLGWHSGLLRNIRAALVSVMRLTPATLKLIRKYNEIDLGRKAVSYV